MPNVNTPALLEADDENSPEIDRLIAEVYRYGGFICAECGRDLSEHDDGCPPLHS